MTKHWDIHSGLEYLLATTYSPNGRQVSSPGFYWQIINHGKVRALPVPRNDHHHSDDIPYSQNLKQLRLAFDKEEIKRLMKNSNLMVRFNKCLERGGLETPTAYILRLVDILKTLDGLESVEEEQKQKTLDAIKTAYTRLKKIEGL